MSSSNNTDTNNNQQKLQYGYVPTEWICITFLSLFGISTILHTLQAFRSRLWWLFPSAIFCGILEVVGWSARLWSSRNPLSQPPYIIQAVTLVIAPTPLIAANFILLGCIIQRLGPQYSLTPRRYTIIFVSSDIISFIVQAMGAGIASGSTSSGSATQAHIGSGIALGGIIFQLLSIFVYCTLAADFLFRYKHDQPVRQSAPVPGEVVQGMNLKDKRLGRVLHAMISVTIYTLIRTIYRVVEFAYGWNSKFNSTEWTLNIFDGKMIALAMYTLNFLHPSIYLRGEDHRSESPSQTSSEGTVMEDKEQGNEV